jgi:hypothetical protein
VLSARAEAAAFGDPEALDLFRLRARTVILRTDENVEYLLVTDGPHCLRLELRGSSVAAGPVRLHYDVVGFGDIRIKILLLARIEALVRLGRIPRGLFPPDPIADRRARAFEAWQLRRCGASQIDIAVCMFGEHAVHLASVDLMRKRVARLLGLAEQRIAVGYRRFFGG